MANEWMRRVAPNISPSEPPVAERRRKGRRNRRKAAANLTAAQIARAKALRQALGFIGGK